MKTFFVVFSLIFTLTTFGQRPDDVLATAAGHTIKLSDIAPEIRLQLERLPADTAQARKSLLDQLINQRNLEIEARLRGMSVGKLLASEKAKAPTPAESQIKLVYEANRTALGGQTLESARKQIIAFLRRDPEQTILNNLFTGLQTKYKATAVKDVNSPTLASGDAVATVNGKAITAREFEDFARIELYEMRTLLSDKILSSLNTAMYVRLLGDEAISLNIKPQALIGREITDKMKDFSDDERFVLEDALSAKLYAKYKVNILYKQPDPLVQNISVDDDPASGAANAPVTVVMFSDFQCSACAAAHPVVKKAIADFPGKIKFVVRDFPLESIHENSFRAALAANAANMQGKFLEYAEKLYANQEALDDASLRKYAADLGLNVKQFELDFNSEKTGAEVRKDMADGEAYGIGSTPTIFVNGVKLRDLSVSGLKTAFDRAFRK